MSQRYYKKLKEEKVVNLFSFNAIKETNSAGRNVNFIFDLPYTFHHFSKHTEMSVVNVSYQNFDVADDDSIFIFRCPQVNTEETYDTYRGNGAVIYHNIGKSNEKSMTEPNFKMLECLNKLTLNVSNSSTDRENGVNTNDFFVITLVIRDYDIELVQPESMPIIEQYHKYPQMTIRY